MDASAGPWAAEQRVSSILEKRRQFMKLALPAERRPSRRRSVSIERRFRKA